MRPSRVVVPGPWPRPAAAALDIESVAPDSAGIALHLGFDVEGDPAPLVAILDVLDRHETKTTFFIQGQWAEANVSLVEEIAARGHEFGNHAYGVDPLGLASEEAIADELARTERLIANATGSTTKPFFRPPYGDRTESSVRAAAEAGYTTIRWSGAPNDIVPEATADSICRELLFATRAGAILLAHTFQPVTPEALDRYLTQIHEDGLVIVPLSVLLSDDPESFIVDR